MATIKHAAFSRNLYFAAIVLYCLIALTSCARKIRFTNSLVVPAAEGSVKLKKDKNNNYTIDLSVTNLAAPQRLSPPKQTYIVWMETEGSGTKNIGLLNSSSSLFSSALKSSLKTVTAFKPVRIYITAEDNSTTQYPAGQVVLNTTNF
jgi:hypothetical protein